MNQSGLFQPVIEPDAPRPGQKASGYARPPGTGPSGETCKTCAHCTRLNYHARVYYKCAVIRHRWTHGPGTDIKLRSPACEMWEIP